MNLIEFREFFRTTSGRFDLVNAAFADTGIGPYIAAGQKYLDRIVTADSSYARYFKDIVVDDYYVMLPKIRAIEEVWIIDEVENSRVLLKNYTFSNLRECYVEVDVSDDTVVRGPVGYCIGKVRIATGSDTPPTSVGDISSDPDNEVGITFWPPASQAYTLEIVGLFHSTVLTNNTDENYWTVNNPLILYMAVMRQLEVMHRNSEGVKDWTSSIREELLGLEMDFVHEEVANVNQMEG